MPIKLGNSSISKCYLGSTVVNKIYQGATQAYSGVITDIVMPTPSFGSANLRMWLDTNKTWTDMSGGSQPSMWLRPKSKSARPSQPPKT